MGCCNYNPPKITSSCGETMNERLRYGMVTLSANTRKILKLLTKQYVIYSIRKDANLVKKDNVKESEIVITYFSQSNPKDLFEWKFDSRELCLT
jgi:hypothetical protein